jgi:ferredoxin-NADP reductase
MQETLQVMVAEVRTEAADIISLKLVSADPSRPLLPPADAGSHIDLLLAENLRRSYSLFRPSDGTSYEVAVQLEAGGRGGSRYVHENVKQGRTISISHPRNNFALRSHHDGVVLIGGGIGITPLFAMLHTLLQQHKDVQLIYCARSRLHAAFLDEISKLADTAHRLSVIFVFEESDGKPDLIKLLAEHGPEHAYYCCGPSGMLKAFESACNSLGYQHCFMERFGASEDVVVTQSDGYEVELARSGTVLQVPAGTPLLNVLLDAGVDIAYSCQEGACGSCETAVLAGEIDHRDCLLSEDEKAQGKTMFVCVSGCKSKKLVLDL